MIPHWTGCRYLALPICDADKDINRILFLNRDGKQVNLKTYMMKKI